MVSTIRFRSFKDVKINALTMLFVAFTVGSSAIIAYRYKPQFVLVWLLGFYILFGILESLWQLPGRLRERAALAAQAEAEESGSTPPPAK
jgi:CDP-diacylglycerol--serine O-phosphatidyltransferase